MDALRPRWPLGVSPAGFRAGGRRIGGPGEQAARLRPGSGGQLPDSIGRPAWELAEHGGHVVVRIESKHSTRRHDRVQRRRPLGADVGHSGRSTEAGRGAPSEPPTALLSTLRTPYPLAAPPSRAGIPPPGPQHPPRPNAADLRLLGVARLKNGVPSPESSVGACPPSPTALPPGWPSPARSTASCPADPARRRGAPTRPPQGRAPAGPGAWRRGRRRRRSSGPPIRRGGRSR